MDWSDPTHPLSIFFQHKKYTKNTKSFGLTHPSTSKFFWDFLDFFQLDKIP